MERLTDIAIICQGINGGHRYGWIVYQRPREPQEFYAMTGEMIMQKHLDLLVSNSMVVKEGASYWRIQ